MHYHGPTSFAVGDSGKRGSLVANVRGLYIYIYTKTFVINQHLPLLCFLLETWSLGGTTISNFDFRNQCHKVNQLRYATPMNPIWRLSFHSYHHHSLGFKGPPISLGWHMSPSVVAIWAMWAPQLGWRWWGAGSCGLGNGHGDWWPGMGCTHSLHQSGAKAVGPTVKGGVANMVASTS